MSSNTIQYEKGTIKVVWVKDDPHRIFSKMFNTEKEAESFAQQKKDYIIFGLIRQKNMEEFEWEILPYGKYKIYTRLVRFYHKHKHTLIRFLSRFI